MNSTRRQQHIGAVGISRIKQSIVRWEERAILQQAARWHRQIPFVIVRVVPSAWEPLHLVVRLPLLTWLARNLSARLGDNCWIETLCLAGEYVC